MSGLHRRSFITQALGGAAFYLLPGWTKDDFNSLNDFLPGNSSFLMPIDFKDIKMSGPLKQRAAKNFDRLEEAKYQPPQVYITGNPGVDWPGDTEGRTMLGLTLEAQANHRAPKYLEDIIALWPKKVNERGYLGQIEPAGVFSEQQLASHGWVLRSLCEYYTWTKDAKVLGYIKNIDASLTGMRSLLRYYETSTRDASLLKAVQQRYQLYRKYGMTENYENYNWFGRPQWTEPCAVIDSFIVATQLWRFTSDSSYLEDAHHIYFNGMEVEQRANGGFGLQSCSGSKDPYTKVFVNEADGCCTMRGGEGMSRAVQYSFFKDAKKIVIPFFYDCEATIRFGSKSLQLTETTKYPNEGSVQFTVLNNTLPFAPEIRLAAPSWTKEHEIQLNKKTIPFNMEEGFIVLKQLLKKGDVLDLTFNEFLGSASTLNQNTIPGYHTFRYGPLIVGYKGENEIAIGSNVKLLKKGDEEFQVEGGDIVLHPLRHFMSPEATKENKFSRQILFKES